MIGGAGRYAWWAGAPGQADEQAKPVTVEVILAEWHERADTPAGPHLHKAAAALHAGDRMRAAGELELAATACYGGNSETGERLCGMAISLARVCETDTGQAGRRAAPLTISGQIGLAAERHDAWRHEHRGARGEWTRALDAEVVAKLAGDIDWAAAVRSGHGDSALLAVARAQGFDGKPHEVSDSELDALVAAGHREMFRGVKDINGGDGSSARHADQFAHGDYFPGLGTWGNGTYTAHTDIPGEMKKLEEDDFKDEERDADGNFTDRLAQRDWNRQSAKIQGRAHRIAAGYAGAHGTLTRMALDKDARVADAGKLRAEWQAALKDLSSQQPPDVSKMLLFTDMGRYAAAQGYDAVDLSAMAPGEMLVLNRTALHISAKTTDGKEDAWQSS